MSACVLLKSLSVIPCMPSGAVACLSTVINAIRAFIQFAVCADLLLESDTPAQKLSFCNPALSSCLV